MLPKQLKDHQRQLKQKEGFPDKVTDLWISDYSGQVGSRPGSDWF